MVTFHRLSPDTTKVMVQMDFEPDGVVETAGDKLGVVKHRVKGDLERFKDFIEDRAPPPAPGEATSASSQSSAPATGGRCSSAAGVPGLWRGTVTG